jgi:hypothetical protein
LNSGKNDSALYEYISSRENVFIDITRLDSFVIQSLEKMHKRIGSGHLCFGTMAPFQYIHPSLVKVRFAKGINVQKVLCDNI